MRAVERFDFLEADKRAGRRWRVDTSRAHIVNSRYEAVGTDGGRGGAQWLILRAIAHPARFRIVKLLGRAHECVCGDLVDELPLAQSTVSERLKVLKDAGVVRGNISGPNTCYCLEPDALAWLRREFGALSESCC